MYKMKNYRNGLGRMLSLQMAIPLHGYSDIALWSGQKDPLTHRKSSHFDLEKENKHEKIICLRNIYAKCE
jgi:hypothetical protein